VYSTRIPKGIKARSKNQRAAVASVNGAGLDAAVVDARQIMRISRRDPVALDDWRRYSQQPIRSVAMRWRSMAVLLGSRPGFLQKRHCRSFLAKSSKLEVARSWRSLVGGDAGSLVRLGVGLEGMLPCDAEVSFELWYCGSQRRV
jgi:hypothetical protein